MVYGRCVGRVSLSGTVNAPGRVGPNSLDKVSFRPGLVYGYFRDLGLFCLVTQRLSTISRVPESIVSGLPGGQSCEQNGTGNTGENEGRRTHAV